MGTRKPALDPEHFWGYEGKYPERLLLKKCVRSLTEAVPRRMGLRRYCYMV